MTLRAPLGLAGLRRTHGCGELRPEHAGGRVTLFGWVQRRRDHGGLIFVDLRDRTGLVQLVFNPATGEAAFAEAGKLRSEYVVAVVGQVRPRARDRVNPNLATGEVEVFPDEVRILNPARTPPLPVEDRIDVDEAVRLRYRYLDLRRAPLQSNLLLRHRVAKAVRDFFDRQGFVEVETPFLTRSTPEGARDYLVPSRVHPGRFYALPQSPQLFKQILMVAGLERYFQIVRCFRDEDLRADRQPEFTQIDVELSFADAGDVLDLTEAMIVEVYRRVLGVSVERPFPRLAYREAMARFGTDKPDLRFGLELFDLTPLAAASGFRVFRRSAEEGGVVKGIRAPGLGGLSRKEMEAFDGVVRPFGAPGVLWLAVGTDGVRSPARQHLSDGEVQEILTRAGATAGDLVLIVAGAADVVHASLGALRLEVARRLGLTERTATNGSGALRFCWVVEFPLLEYSAEEGRWVAVHHPFTAPLDEDEAFLESDPARVRAKAYDLVLNGVELGGGSVRIHRRDLQERVFKVLGLEETEAAAKFGFLLEAFEYGTPPHAGIALGLDRLVMMMAGAASLRDVIAFPKTASATDLLTGAPAEVSPAQLRELRLKLSDGR